MQMKLYVEAFGCTMNQGETEMLMEDYIARGHRRVHDPKQADIAIIGTCVVIGKTEERMKRRIAELDRSCNHLIITGCLTKQKDEIQCISPGAEIVYHEDIPMTTVDDYDATIGTIPISSGCTGDCAYCITNLVRGELRSRPVVDIHNRFKAMVSSGVKEIRLSCQDTASYGLDIGESLPTLIHHLLETGGEYRIRIGMMNPDTMLEIADDLIEVMEDEHIYRFIHIPLQSGENRILEMMNRRYTVRDFIGLVDRSREAFPDITISTDVIVGFPGESEEDFEKTIKIISRVKPDILNITRFSSRPGTEAAPMEGHVHSREKKKRSKKLTALHSDISRGKNKKYKGRHMRALVLEEGKDNSMVARTDNYKVVVLKGSSEDLLGKWIDVQILSSSEVYLLGDRI